MYVNGQVLKQMAKKAWNDNRSCKKGFEPAKVRAFDLNIELQQGR
jgi:hypothetical protein